MPAVPAPVPVSMSPSFLPRSPRAALSFIILALGAGTAASATPTAAPQPPVDPAAMHQLVDAVSLDVMSEASVNACEDTGAASFEQVRAAWAAWRERHQLARLGQVLKQTHQQMLRKPPAWEEITQPVRQRVLNDPAPDAACAALARDWQTAGMDATALYPRAGEAAAALVSAGLATTPQGLPVVDAPPPGPFIVPGQVEALHAQHDPGWSFLSQDQAQQKLGWVYVKGRVKRGDAEVFPFQLAQDQGDRVIGTPVYLKTRAAEGWVGREIVLRGLVTTLNSYSMTLENVALVTDTGGLTPSPLKMERWSRKPVMLRRVLSPAGKGVADKDVAAVVIFGKTGYDGMGWFEDVRFLLRDGSVYHRTRMPPDELNVAASRQLEPQQWGRWRQTPAGYEMQSQDADGKPRDDWQLERHYAVKPWPRDMRLDGRYTHATFSGSLMLGGVSSKRSLRFTRDGRFERSDSSFAGSGGMAAMNGAVISASSQRDGSGSRSIAGGTAAGAGATSGVRTVDDGASRRGRYQLSGYALTLDFDDGHQERLLCFPVNDSQTTVYVDNSSYGLDK